MKKLYYIIIAFMIFKSAEGQQLYCDFDGVKVVTFGASTGTIDSLFANPHPDLIDNSPNCAKYIRASILYDNIKFYPDSMLHDVTLYASNSPLTPKMTIKLYSSAPIGTLVQLQLGSKSDDNYPSGIHSEYQTFTTAQNAWQNLFFDYYQSPAGSLVSATQVNKVVLLYNPEFAGQDTIYFDDLTGPELLSNVPVVPDAGILPAMKLYQNAPNPVKENTHINFQINSAGFVSLELFDMLGNSVSSLLNQNMKAGSYSIPVATENIPNGIYFYMLKTENGSRSKKMIISK
jgi:hypothetical protein